MKNIELILPIETVSESNCSEHWRKKHERHRKQKAQIVIAFHQLKINAKMPCAIRLSRMSPRVLDSDNLVSSLKWIRDAIAEQITGIKIAGRADDHPGIIFEYDQERSPAKGVRIFIYENEEHSRKYNRLKVYEMLKETIKDENVKKIITVFSFDELKEFIEDTKSISKIDLYQIDLMPESEREAIFTKTAVDILKFASKYKKKISKIYKFSELEEDDRPMIQSRCG